MVENFNLLEDAVERNTPISLIFPSTGVAKSYRSRLLSVGDDGVLLESVDEMTETINSLIQSGQPVRVWFRADVRKVEFDTPIVQLIRAHKLNATTKINALLVKVPTAIKAVQRRSDYRATVPSDGDLKFNFFRVSEQDDFSIIPAETARLTVDVRDCSAGGIGGIWKRKTTDPASLAANQRFRIDIESPVGKCTLEGRLRFFDNLPDPFFKRVGIQFTINAASLPDRQKTLYLNKLLNELQRMELKRKRYGR